MMCKLIISSANVHFKEIERERERDRETERQREGKRETDRERQTERGTEKRQIESVNTFVYILHAGRLLTFVVA